MESREPDTARLSAQARGLRDLRRAERLAERGQVAEAIRTLDTAMRHGADEYTCYLRQARLYQGRRQWSEAVTVAEKAIQLHPDRLTAREAVIALRLESGDYAGAVDASKALLRISPRHVPARDALGAAYFGLGDIDSALNVTDELIRINPSDAAQRLKKALLCQHRNDLRGAMEQLIRVADSDEEDELRQTARQQLESLEAYQLTSILTLAVDDPFFRAALQDDVADAAAARGYFLSPPGIEALRDALIEIRGEIDPASRVSLYH